ncbi:MULTISPECIES: hypothetical protein [unclassified Streptomyces]|uniref:hypothetical protein n=1 Tax=unclassified Streptomyces TaxID=2593676 RepID=UPI00364DF4DC
MHALGFVFVTLPCLAILSFTAFAACRAQRPKVFKTLAHVFLAFGLICGLTPVGVMAWIAVIA